MKKDKIDFEILSKRKQSNENKKYILPDDHKTIQFDLIPKIMKLQPNTLSDRKLNDLKIKYNQTINQGT